MTSVVSQQQEKVMQENGEYDLEIDGVRLGCRFVSAIHALCWAYERGLVRARWVCVSGR